MLWRRELERKEQVRVMGQMPLDLGSNWRWKRHGPDLAEAAARVGDGVVTGVRSAKRSKSVGANQFSNALLKWEGHPRPSTQPDHFPLTVHSLSCHFIAVSIYC